MTSDHQSPSVETAVRGALKTRQECPSALPETPTGWEQSAASALEDGDSQRLMIAGLQLRSAHSQYKADFDHNASLFDIRQALPELIRHYRGMGLPG